MYPQNHSKHRIKSRRIHRKKPKVLHVATLKPPTSYLVPNPKFHDQATEKSSENLTTTVYLDIHASSTLNPVYEYSEEINNRAEKAFNERRQHLWEVCEKSKVLGKFAPNAWEFFISPGHGLAWCNVFKAASSTWMYYFNILGKKSDFKQFPRDL